MVFLDPVRSLIPPTARKRAYDIATAIVAGLGMWGYLDTTEVMQWTSVAVSAVALVFAVLYSTSTIRMTLYTLCGSLGVVAGSYGVLTGSQAAGIMAVAVAVLGIAVAGSEVPKAGVTE